MKTEAHNGIALQDYTRYIRAPRTIKFNNVQSKLGTTWIKHCKDVCIENITTEPIPCARIQLKKDLVH